MLHLDQLWRMSWSRSFVFSIFALIIPFLFTIGAAPTIRPNHQLTAPTTLADLKISQSPLALKEKFAFTVNHGYVTQLDFVITSTSREPLQLADGALQIHYRDHRQRLSNLAWSWLLQGEASQNRQLDRGEALHVTIPLENVLDYPLGPSRDFVIELQPAHGAILSLREITPAYLDPHVALEAR